MRPHGPKVLGVWREPGLTDMPEHEGVGGRGFPGEGRELHWALGQCPFQEGAACQTEGVPQPRAGGQGTEAAEGSPEAEKAPRRVGRESWEEPGRDKGEGRRRRATGNGERPDVLSRGSRVITGSL